MCDESSFRHSFLRAYTNALIIFLFYFILLKSMIGWNFSLWKHYEILLCHEWVKKKTLDAKSLPFKILPPITINTIPTTTSATKNKARQTRKESLIVLVS